MSASASDAASSDGPVRTGSGAARGNGRVGMLLFLVADAAGFVALLLAYAVLRARAVEWPARGSRLSIPFTIGLTIVLLASSVTMVRAIAAGRAGRTRALAAWLGATMLGGLLFLGGQAHEWHTLVRDKGMHLGADQMASTFFVVTGFHGAHVLAGVVLLAVTLMRARSGRVNVDAVGLYWNFVDLVWLFVFVAVYLI